jgi:hypothetical protein
LDRNQKFIKWLNAKVNAASKEVDGEKSEEEQVPEDVAVYQWCGFKSRRGKNKNLTALKSNSNTVWFNF